MAKRSMIVAKENVLKPAWWQREGLPGLLLVGVVFLAYFSVWQAGFIWDDDAYITNSGPLRSWAGLGQIWFQPGTTEQYYPLTDTTFWIEYHLWGLRPLGYHLDNLWLHGGNAVLLWVLLRKLGVKGAWLGAALFALHPVSVESVAWVTERKNTLSGFFYLGSLLAAVAFWQLDAPEKPPRRWGFFWLAFALYFAALLSKTAAVPLPAVILLLLWWKRPGLKARDFFPVAPFFVLGLVMGIVTLLVEKFYVGTTGAAWDFSLAQRLIIAGKVVWFYLGKLVWPHPLIFVYPRWEIVATRPLMYVPLVAAVGGMIFLWRKRNTRWQPVFVAMTYFLMLLFPVCGLFSQYFFRFSYVEDHLQYLASMGPLALVGWGIVSGLDFYKDAKPWLKPVVIGVLLLLMGTLTSFQSRMYRDTETLWRTTLDRNPACWMADNNLGVTLQESGRVDEGIAHEERAIQMKPDYEEAYNNLGNALLKKGDTADAMKAFAQALAVDPDYAEAHVNLGNALLNAGQIAGATDHYREAVRLRPRLADGHNGLGNALLRVGQNDGAIEQYAQALQIRPNYAEAHNNLGDALLAEGRFAESIEQYVQALRIQPDYAEARNNLGNVLLKVGRSDDAIQQEAEAIRLQPGYADAHNNLGNALLKEGRVAEAIDQYAQALQIKPGSADAHFNLGIGLMKAGRNAAAIDQFQQAVKINPNYAQAHNNLGVLLGATGHLTEAIAQFEAALQVDPHYADAKTNLETSRAMQKAKPSKK